MLPKRSIHWSYFLTLEDDLVKASRYVEIAEENYKTHSVEFTRVLLAACSEVDVVAKILCKKKDSNKTHTTMTHYRETIRSTMPCVHASIVRLRSHGIELIPWVAFANDESPTWWTEHNGVKHQRNLNYKDANLENALNAVAGLFVLLNYDDFDFSSERTQLMIVKPIYSSPTT